MEPWEEFYARWTGGTGRHYSRELYEFAFRQGRSAAEDVVAAARDLRAWGVEHDDPRLRYISVQVDRADIEAFDEALSRYDS